MPYVSVHVDVFDVLDDLDDDDLEKEVARRRRKKGGRDDQALPWTPADMAQDLRAAFYARDASRFEALLCVLDKQDCPSLANSAVATFVRAST